MHADHEQAKTVAHQVAERYAAIGLVEAVVLESPSGSPSANGHCAVVLRVYSRSVLPLGLRGVIAGTSSTRPELGNEAGEEADEWIDTASQQLLKVRFKTQRWMEEELVRVLDRHEAALGFSTCEWHHVLAAEVLFDRSSWFTNLRQKARQPYPWKLKGAIISANYPALRESLSSYRHQLERAIQNCDDVMIHDRVGRFVASLIDIVYAVNELPHPGEPQVLKRLEQECRRLPEHFQADVKSLYRAVSVNHLSLLSIIDHIVDRLEGLLRREGLL